MSGTHTFLFYLFGVNDLTFFCPEFNLCIFPILSLKPITNSADDKKLDTNKYIVQRVIVCRIAETPVSILAAWTLPLALFHLGMPHYPYTKLISAGDIVVAIQGPCIRVLREFVAFPSARPHSSTFA